jgi:hypothetical protein
MEHFSVFSGIQITPEIWMSKTDNKVIGFFRICKFDDFLASFSETLTFKCWGKIGTVLQIQ